MAAQERPLVIHAAKILTVTQGEIDDGVLVVRGGKIAALGKRGEVEIPADAEVIDASDQWVMPGQIDLHAHIGNNSGLHDYVHTLNPELRAWDFINLDDDRVRDAVASGITTLLTIPGSGGNNSGFGVLWKLGGADDREGLIIRRLGGMKIAQGYNPERRAGDLGQSRMGMWWLLREMFERAFEYDAELRARGDGDSDGDGPPPAHLKLDLENIKNVVRRDTPIFVHTAGGRDVMGTMRLFHDELDLPVVISHAEFGGFRVGEEAGKRGLHVNVGPRIFDFSSQVFDRRFYSIPGEYVAAGVDKISLNTDSPVIPGDELFLQGVLSVRMGMDEDLALKALTIHPAEAMGVEDRIGSLEVGKDADLVIKRGSLFDLRTPIDLVLINGVVVYRHGQRLK